MSFLAKLYLDGESPVNILRMNLRLSQGTDTIGQVHRLPTGGEMEVVVEATHQSTFSEWMSNATMLKNGKITLFKNDTLSGLAHLNFTDAYCTHMEMLFNYQSNHPFSIRLLITARSLQNEQVTYEKNWPA